VRLLLDTHIWLWSLLKPESLSRRVASELDSAENELWLSPISIWELFILVEKGRVVLDRPPARWVAAVQESVPFQEAPLTGEVAIRSRTIDLPHQDPADRFIAATAAVYGLTLVTSDEKILTSKMVSLLPNA
jgi:PIN domain nuclease of toxin-antitoxin system